MNWQINWNNYTRSNKFNLFDFYFGIFITIFVVIGLYLNYFEIGKLYTDSGIFSAVSINLSKGAKLYVDTWENKPPGIFYLFRFCNLFLSAKNSIFFLGLLSHLIIFISIYSFYYLKSKSLISAFPILLLTIHTFFNSKISSEPLTTELYGTALILISILLIEISKNPKYILIALILLGLAPWFKELFLIPSIVILIIFSKINLKNILAFLLPSFLFLILLIINNNLIEFIKMIEFNFFYIQNKTEYLVFNKFNFLHENLGIFFIFLLFLTIYFSVILTIKTKDIKSLKFLLIYISSFIFILVSPYNLGHYLIPILPFLTVSLICITHNNIYNFKPILNLSILIFILAFGSKFEFRFSTKIKKISEDNIEKELNKNKNSTLFIDYSEAAPYYALSEIKHHAFIPIPLRVHFDDNQYGIKNRERLWTELSKNPPQNIITCHTTSFAYWHLPHNNFYETHYQKIDSNLIRFPDPVYLWKRK